MRLIFFCSILLIGQICFGQTVLIEGNGFKGYIFDTSTFIMKSIKEQKGRHLLTKSDIDKAEKLLKTKLHLLNNDRINQVECCPVIHKKLKMYYRQYVGFINQNGEIIIWINLFWDKDLIESGRSEIIRVNDGCSYFWNIEVNITTGQLHNLIVNGKG